MRMLEHSVFANTTLLEDLVDEIFIYATTSQIETLVDLFLKQLFLTRSNNTVSEVLLQNLLEFRPS